MDPQKLRELIESELGRIGLDKSKVKLAFHTVVEFKDPKSKASVEAPGGQALGFLDSLSEGDIKDYDELEEQLGDFLDEGPDEEEEEDDDEDESDDDEPDGDDADDEEDDGKGG